ncbi:MAG: hypothetical protein ACPG66_07580 [Flavobacteriales bacterium]
MAIQGDDVEARSLGGGMWLVRDDKEERGAGAMSGWRPEVGGRVTWRWTARSLRGDSLTSGVTEFAVDGGAVPRVFHEAAKELGHIQSARLWSPSVSAFGVRGIPGEIPPFSPVLLDVEQRRSVQDSAWWEAVRRGQENESLWLDQFVQTLPQPLPFEAAEGVWAQVHTSRQALLRDGETVLLRIRTTPVRSEVHRETAVEWRAGTPDQIVSALQVALAEWPQAGTLSVWSTSKNAFGEDGAPKAGIPPHTPIRFDVEVVPL